MQKRFMFVSDFHAPNHLPQGVALVAAFARDFKPDILVFGGDIVDFAMASKFIRLNAAQGPQTVREEAEIAVKEVLEPICKAAPRAAKHFLEGNHEIRVLRMLACLKSGMDGLIDLSEFFGCKRLGIEYHHSIAGNAWIEIGPMNFQHGDRYGVNPAKLVLDEWRCPVIFGHAHQESFARKRSPNQKHDAKVWGAGCLAAKATYTDKDPWHRGFVSGWLDEETGEYDAEHISLSGKEFTELYSPHGKYHAYKLQGTGDRWSVKSISNTK